MKFWEAMKALEEGNNVIGTGEGKIICLVSGDHESFDFNLSVVTKMHWEIREEPKPKKQVWQWRYKYEQMDHWEIHNELLTEEQAKCLYSFNGKYEKHAGPFEVEE